MTVSEDKTPADFKLTPDPYVEKLVKKPVRRFAYPVYNVLINSFLKRRYQDKCGFPVDLWLWGQKGNDYERHRRRVNRLCPLKDKNILIAGCGLGYDAASWIKYPVNSLTGIDYFNFERAWNLQVNACRKINDKALLKFGQKDLEDLESFADNSFDLIVSDAVFEHIRDLRKVLTGLRRILRPGGVLYATFGPLWYCWHGDHVSGLNKIEEGYNHLILSKEEYRSFINGLDDLSDQTYDPRMWINEGLFSYLQPKQYLELLEETGFCRLFVAAIIDPRAVKCLKANRAIRERLLGAFSEVDLIVSGMTIIYSKPRLPENNG
ncbi:MAG: class I SAM-dependent methyltransferase [Nitrospirota bacterium]